MATEVATGFKSGSQWRYQEYEEHLYLVNGNDPNQVFDGSVMGLMGIAAPTWTATATEDGSSTWNATNYTYKVTFHNGFKGIDSDPSPVFVTGAFASKQHIDLAGMTASGNPQVGYKRIWRTADNDTSQYYLVATIANATTTYVDTTADATLILGTAYSSLATGLATDDRATPESFKFINAHKLKLFGAHQPTKTAGTLSVSDGSTAVTGSSTHFTSTDVGKTLYVGTDTRGYLISAVASVTALTLAENFARGSSASSEAYEIRGKKNRVWHSVTGKVEYWPTDFLEDIPYPGYEVTGLYEVFDQEFCFTNRGVLIINVDTPSKISFSPFLIGLGCVADRTIAQANNRVIWLDKSQVWSFNQEGAVEPLGERIRPYLATLNQDIISDAAACYWPKYDWYMLSVPSTSATTNDTLLICALGIKGHPWYVWEGIYAEDIAVVTDDAGADKVCWTDPWGWICRLDETRYNDGLPATGDKQGTATAGANSTLTDSTATFNTTGDGLAGLWVWKSTSAGVIEKRRISSNNATVLTITPNWTTNPVAGDVYRIGVIEFEYYSPEMDMGQPVTMKKFGALHAIMDNEHTTPAATMTGELYLDGESTAADSSTFDLTLDADWFHFEAQQGLRGQIRLHDWNVDVPIKILDLAVEWEPLDIEG